MNYAFIDPKERYAMASENSDFEFLVPTGFEWDEEKSKANLIKHGIDFEDASEVFYWPVIVRGSNRNSEERWIAIGKSHDRIVSVIFTRRNDVIRIISARHPRPNEERAYRNASMGRSAQGKD
ncbi:BrnT family toxin [Bradyrhizobium erythrophlei]|jgi:uncharacterized DUF497 family protein|uniref:Uncharacterized protein n=1 Tax=Bradyrhizobium erythrophlei TaxID=1437360 RepID=A0A1M5ID02_9BRAD|nr:BrnT family toxin [Bradyrhizobium erythrophlei]SHG25780.1 hypothetical protein SAMN05443248_0911 [Bradyrhizobium erythrophlei]